MPKHESFKAFQSRAWREHKTIDPAYRSHGERKFFACHYYAQQMGVNPPVVAGIKHGRDHHDYIAKTLSISLKEAKDLDKEVQLRLSKLLGHHP